MLFDRYGDWQYHRVGLPVIGSWSGGWGGYGPGYWGNSYYNRGEHPQLSTQWRGSPVLLLPMLRQLCATGSHRNNTLWLIRATAWQLLDNLTLFLAILDLANITSMMSIYMPLHS